jgi:small subunit ribosomal protein S14
MKKHIYYYRDKTEIVKKKILQQHILKFIKKNYYIQNTLKQRLMLKTFKINQKFNFNKLKKYCLLTGRLRFIISKNKFSRIVFRELASFGQITGVFKV